MFFFEMSRAILPTAHFSASDSMRRAEFQELLSARNFSVLSIIGIQRNLPQFIRGA